jgi:peptidoglycan/xylan/chitin deacetylase (PgdA/CDA1 family)
LTRFVKGIVNPVLDGSGVYDSWLQGLAQRPHWTILMYHRVINDKSEDPFDMGMCVTRERFEAQISYLARTCEIVPLGETLARVASGTEPHRGRMVSITFDDGYRDNLTLAAPVMEREGVPFTLFVATGGMETGEPFWWDRVILSFARSARPELAIDLPGRGPARFSLAPLRRAQAVRDLVDALWEHPDEGRLELIAEIERQLDVDGRALAPARLTSDEVVALARAGVEIGAHSVSHRNMSRLSPTDVAAEMSGSRARLQALCGQPVDGFAYPAGYVTPAVTAAARDAGFSYAVGTRSEINIHPLPLYELDRIGMPDVSTADFKRSWGTRARRIAAPAGQAA